MKVRGEKDREREREQEGGRETHVLVLPGLLPADDSASCLPLLTRQLQLNFIRVSTHSTAHAPSPLPPLLPSPAPSMPQSGKAHDPDVEHSQLGLQLLLNVTQVLGGGRGGGGRECHTYIQSRHCTCCIMSVLPPAGLSAQPALPAVSLWQLWRTVRRGPGQD